MKRPLFNAKEFSQRIEAVLALRDLSVRAAAKEIGCIYSSLSRIRAGRTRLELETYLRIETWLAKHERPR
jgi:predicted signal transduction protein with EAL and GGDEF domain